MMMGDEGSKTCGCFHHKTGGILVILFGLLFLLGNWGYVSAETVSWSWPVLVILGGAFGLTKSWCKCC